MEHRRTTAALTTSPHGLANDVSITTHTPSTHTHTSYSWGYLGKAVCERVLQAHLDASMCLPIKHDMRCVCVWKECVC